MTPRRHLAEWHNPPGPSTSSTLLRSPFPLRSAAPPCILQETESLSPPSASTSPFPMPLPSLALSDSKVGLPFFVNLLTKRDKPIFVPYAVSPSRAPAPSPSPSSRPNMQTLGAPIACLSKLPLTLSPSHPLALPHSRPPSLLPSLTLALPHSCPPSLSPSLTLALPPSRPLFPPSVTQRCQCRPLPPPMSRAKCSLAEHSCSPLR